MAWLIFEQNNNC